MSWTKQQEAVFRWFAGGQGHLAIEALAGSGKTSTLLEGVGRAPDASVLVCAYNKRIQLELEERISQLPRKNVAAMTLHALGLKVVKRHWPAAQIDDRRTEKIVKMVAKGHPYKTIKGLIATAYMIKEVAPRAATVEKVVNVAAEFGTWSPESDLDEEIQAQLVLDTLAECRRPSGTIDFSDMVWLPIVNDWDMPFRYKMVIVDEAQDASAVQWLLAKQLFVDRLAFAGDPNQCLYEFRGANEFEMSTVATDLRATQLPLTVTFRCSRAVVAEANKIVPELEARDDAPAGRVTTIDYEKLDPEPGSFVLSRTNAPLVATCLALRARGVDARIEGKESLDFVLGVFEKVCRMGSPFANSLQLWCNREVALAQTEASPQRELRALDVTKILQTLSEHAPVTQIPRLLRDLHQAKGDDLVTCSTVHKAKGLEADNVYMLKETLPQYRDDVDPAAVTAESYRIEYVAITRARERFTWVSKADGW